MQVLYISRMSTIHSSCYILFLLFLQLPCYNDYRQIIHTYSHLLSIYTTCHDLPIFNPFPLCLLFLVLIEHIIYLILFYFSYCTEAINLVNIWSSNRHPLQWFCPNYAELMLTGLHVRNTYLTYVYTLVYNEKVYICNYGEQCLIHSRI
jgi:hypothetical protein